MSDFERVYYESEHFWQGSMVQDAGNLKRISKTIELIPSRVETLLDAGCGNGVFAGCLAQSRPSIKIQCMDRSETALNEVKVGERIKGELTAIPVESNSVDCVTCLQVLEHLTCPDFKIAVAELARVTSRCTIVSVPYREQTERNVTTCPMCKTTFNVDLHMRQFSEQSFSSLFDGHGLRLKESAFPGAMSSYLGLPTWYRFRRALQHSESPQFNSPICPLCGYSEPKEVRNNHETRESKPLKASSQSTVIAAKPKALNSSNGVKGAIKRFWPKTSTPGYWIVGLFEKIENSN